MKKFTDGYLLQKKFLNILTHDDSNWSDPKYLYRVRFNGDYVCSYDKTKSLKDVLGSNTKAKRVTGYLGLDYKPAVGGLYTNSINGIARITQRYPNLIKSIQTYDQYIFANAFSDYLRQELELKHELEKSMGVPSRLLK